MNAVMEVLPNAMVGKTTLEQFFLEMDIDKDGSLDRDEFITGMTREGRLATDNEVELSQAVFNLNQLFDCMDKDGMLHSNSLFAKLFEERTVSIDSIKYSVHCCAHRLLDSD